MKIDTFLYSYYSEFYADSEFATISRFTSIFLEILTLKVCPISQKCRFWARFAMENGLFRYQSIDSDQGRYWAAMLGSVVAGACTFWSVPLVPIPAPSPVQSVLLRAGTGPVILCIYRKMPIGAGFAERSHELLYDFWINFLQIFSFLYKFFNFYIKFIEFIINFKEKWTNIVFIKSSSQIEDLK